MREKRRLNALPTSVTPTRDVIGAGRDCTATRPGPRVNLIAFENRFQNTR
jgi:hypothetical protein